MEPEDLAMVKRGLVCTFPNLTDMGWDPSELRVQVSGNGQNWVALSQGFVSLPQPSLCGNSCTSGAGRGAGISATAMLVGFNVLWWLLFISL